MDMMVNDSKEEKPIITQRRILKNILIIGVVFFNNFVAFSALQHLQSSLNLEKGMGTLSLSCLYITMSISSLFVPQLGIQNLGHKWCISFSLIGYLVWMAANGYAGMFWTCDILSWGCYFFETTQMIMNTFAIFDTLHGAVQEHKNQSTALCGHFMIIIAIIS